MNAKPSIAPSSYWRQTAALGPAFPRLETYTRAEVVVVGAGITGLTAAWTLKQAGKKVVVLEASQVGGGTSGGTTGHLDAYPDRGLANLVQSFGESATRIAVTARRAAIDQIERLAADAPDVDFRRVPAYLYTERPSRLEWLQKEYEAAAAVGLPATLTSSVPLPFACAGGLRIEGQARMNALAYVRHLALRVHGDGSTVYEATRVMRPPRDAAPCVVQTDQGRVEADAVLLATHSAFLGISELDFRVAPYQSYAMMVRTASPLDDALYWDDEQPYHYTRLAHSGSSHELIIGGADHKTGQGGDERDSLRALENYARRRWNVERIEHRWSAEFFEPSDGLPYVGRVPFGKHIYVATGFSGSGLTWGTAAGMLLADLVLGRENPLAPVITPSRIKPLAGGTHLISENLNVVRRFIADRFRGQHVGGLEDLESLTPGQGRLVRVRGEQLAVYRDEQGMLHVRSPRCTHAGCIVSWNEEARTWDCPCHGGRFSPLGERIYGPPPKDLKAVSLEEVHRQAPAVADV